MTSDDRHFESIGEAVIGLSLFLVLLLLVTWRLALDNTKGADYRGGCCWSSDVESPNGAADCRAR